MRLRAGWRGAMVGLKMLPAGLAAQGAPAEFTQVHLGMPVRIVAVADGPDASRHSAEAADAAFARIAELEAIFSDWRSSSELRRLEEAAVGEWHVVSAPLFEVLGFALGLAAATDGAFDPTIGSLTRLWREAAARTRPMDETARAEARARVGYRAVALDSVGRRVRLLRPGVQFDLGAVAKGYIVDEALATLRALGLRAALVEAGGEIAGFGAPPGERGWRIATDATVLILVDGAISSSGSEQQRLDGADGTVESHVIDPTTGRGLPAARRATVTGPRAMVTDALATAATLVPAERAQALARIYGVTMLRR